MRPHLFSYTPFSLKHIFHLCKITFLMWAPPDTVVNFNTDPTRWL